MKRKLALFFCLLSIAYYTQAQMIRPSSGGNKKASITEWIGITRVKIDYDRPAVKGREGKIWGQVVHYGFADLDYGTSKAAPWRAGANENTTIEFGTDVYIEGKPIKAGKYGFFIALGLEKATLIFSNFNNAWGSFYYNSTDDALRVEVPIVKTNESVERLRYEFSDQEDSTAVLALEWEKIKIPFKISVELQKERIAAYRREFNSASFNIYWQNMQEAANYCLINNINLKEGLDWAERSINSYYGESNFLTLSTYAGLLEKFGRTKEADSTMKIAFPKGTTLQLHSYGRSLMLLKKVKEAFDVYQLNYKKTPDNIYTLIGMIRAYAAIGNTQEALVFGEKALALATSSNDKAYVDKLIQDVKAGKNINF